MLPFYLINQLPPFRNKFKALCLNRARQIASHLTPYITQSDQVLDLGCGTGSVIKVIQQQTHCQATLVDVHSNPLCDQSPVYLYDGHHLPFAANQFTTTLLTAVLHHTKNPTQVLAEARRVTTQQIIVMEDVFTDAFSHLVTFIGDCLLNWEIHSPFTNHSASDWDGIFRAQGFKVDHFDQFQLWAGVFPFELAVFVLTKNPS